MTLQDLKAEIYAEATPKVLVFNCPCPRFEVDGPDRACFGRIRLYLRFEGDPPTDKMTWDASGEFPNLTLKPSVNIHPSGEPVGSYCAGWHGFITNGELKSC